MNLLLLAALLAPQSLPKFPETPKLPRMAAPDTPGLVEIFDLDDANNHPDKKLLYRPSEGEHLSFNSITEPTLIVVEGMGHNVDGLGMSPDSCALYVYDLALNGAPNSYAPVSCVGNPPLVPWADPMPNVDEDGLEYQPGTTAFIDCLFGGGGLSTVSWNITHPLDADGNQVPIAGMYDGQVAAKWMVNGKGPRHWIFSGCVFEASQEHALYLHWPYSVYIESCIFGPDGGCPIQIVWRYGRPGTGAYYGHPGFSPPSEGDIVVRRCSFNDFPFVWGREATCVTVVGWTPGDVYLKDLYINGARGAIAFWLDPFKGAYSRKTNGDTFAAINSWEHLDNIQVPPGGGEANAIQLLDDWTGIKGMPFNRIIVDNVRVDWNEGQDREQAMFGGFRELFVRDLYFDPRVSKPKLCIGAEGSGPWPFGRVKLYGDYPEPVTWNPETERYVPLVVPTRR